MRIALTGGAGLIGRAVAAQALADGHTVVEIDQASHTTGPASPEPPPGSPSGLERRVADATEHAALQQAVDGCDALIHLAAHVNPLRMADHVVHNDNVVASYNALSVAARLGIERVCLASSINAIGGAYSRQARYDYFPVDECHPTYNEDPYSLSKWVAEAQADSLARRYPMTIASLRLHGVRASRPHTRPEPPEPRADVDTRHLWGYTLLAATARAFMHALLAPFTGHETFFIVAPDTLMATPTEQLCRTYYPDVPLRRPLPGNQGLFDCGKAEQLLGWRHDGVRPGRSG
jgi:nucleoside-diphosphate-sugar epimerase